MTIVILAEMACTPEHWMVAGSFEDMFDKIEIVQPDKIYFTATLDQDEVDTLIYDIEDHFNDLGVDYHSIDLEDN